jgi:DNA-3-methyladenine glycosylase I
MYRAYHDLEWGSPLHDEDKHFEFLLLETMQAGLSWHIVLNKREQMRTAFDDFDYRKIARYDEKKLGRLLGDSGIIRNRRKIEAATKNAKAFLETQREFGSFDNYIWSWTGGRPQINEWKTSAEVPAKSELSDRVSQDMKKRGYAFVGSVTVYAHLQAIGLVNDHLVSCFRWAELGGGAVGKGRARR